MKSLLCIGLPNSSLERTRPASKAGVWNVNADEARTAKKRLRQVAPLSSKPLFGGVNEEYESNHHYACGKRTSNTYLGLSFSIRGVISGKVLGQIKVMG